jgi:hypothetical protein
MLIDLQKRKRLIDKIKGQEGVGTANAPLPIVSLEDFFIGNDDRGSIGCNLLEHPGAGAFFSILQEIRARENVQDAFVEIMEIEEDEMTWPFSERIYILANADLPTVAEWVTRLEPDDVEEGYAYGVPPSAPSLRPGMKVYGVWWD